MISPTERGARCGQDGSGVVAELVMLWVFVSQSIAELLLMVRSWCGAAGAWFPSCSDRHCTFFLLSDSNVLPRRLGTTGNRLGRAGGLEGKAASSGDATPVLPWVSTALFQYARFSSLGLNLFTVAGEERKKQGDLK